MSKLTRYSVFTNNKIATLLSTYKVHRDYLNRKCDAYDFVIMMPLVLRLYN